jgi:ribosomal protein L37AE/L43A
MMNALFGELCARCGTVRTKKEFDGIPTCDPCKLKLEAKTEDLRSCPDCSVAMAKVIVSNVIIDRCPKCNGTWFDAGELEVLKAAIQAGADSGLTTGILMGMAIN